MNRQEMEKKVIKILGNQINERGYATVVDALVDLGWLREDDVQRWRKGQVPYLEKVCQTNLSKLTYFSKLYRKFACDRKLPMRFTGYVNKKTQRPLRFSKYGQPQIEKNYALHIICKDKLLKNKNVM